jgi:hypothetical protein
VLFVEQKLKYSTWATQGLFTPGLPR